MPNNFSADSFCIKKLCRRLSSRETQFYLEKSLCVPTVKLLLVIIEGVTAEALRVNIDLKSAFRKESVWAKILGRRGRLPLTVLRVGKTRMINLSYSIRMWAEDNFISSGCMHLTDGQTERRQQ